MDGSTAVFIALPIVAAICLALLIALPVLGDRSQARASGPGGHRDLGAGFGSADLGRTGLGGAGLGGADFSARAAEPAGVTADERAASVAALPGITASRAAGWVGAGANPPPAGPAGAERSRPSGPASADDAERPVNVNAGSADDTGRSVPAGDDTQRPANVGRPVRRGMFAVLATAVSLLAAWLTSRLRRAGI